jgi:inhibitor of cysteine peptidase
MISRTTGIFLIAGIIIGIVIASLSLVVLFPAGSRGGCPGIIPGVSLDTIGAGSDMGAIPEFSSEEQAQKFLISHTSDGGSGSGSVASSPGTTAGTVSPGGERAWSFDVDTATFKPDEYIVTASAVRQDATATALFNVLERPAGPFPQLAGGGSSSGNAGEYYITIDPVGDHYIGERFTITGTTNIPADDEMLVQVYSSSFKPTQKSQSGEFSGATGTVKTSAAGSSIAAPVVTAVPTVLSTAAGERKHSGTNTQVGGVDEADIVKTNGTYLYAVTGNTLRILDAYPADHARIVATLKFSGSPRSLYLYQDRAVVISEESGTREFWKCEKLRCADASWSRPTTQVYVFGVSDPAHPVLVRQLSIDGSLSDSRMIGSSLYYVTTSSAGVTTDGNTFPQVLDYETGAVKPNVYYFDRTDREFSYSMVGSFDVTGRAPVKAKTFLIGSAGTVYVSPGRMYIGIATPADDSGAMQTDIYAFTLDKGRIAYAAQGTVNGALLNQFSLDEYGGRLRLATTGIEGAGKYKGYFSTVWVLDSSMQMVGSLKKLAPGKQISAARFAGNRLYLGTRLGSDPLLVIDLSDPANPRQLGELQLPGSASYLHPYDESYLISVGREANNGGIRLALINVTNVSAPVVTDTLELGGRGSDSEVLRDHKAFLFDRDANLLVLPVHLVGQSGTAAYKKYQPPEDVSYWGGAYVFSVAPSQGFHVKGMVGHYDSRSGSYAPVMRSLYIENTLYTVSSDMVVMSDLDNNLALVNSLAL